MGQNQAGKNLFRASRSQYQSGKMKGGCAASDRSESPGVCFTPVCCVAGVCDVWPAEKKCAAHEEVLDFEWCAVCEISFAFGLVIYA